MHPGKQKQRSKSNRKKGGGGSILEQINHHAAGIDVGSRSHFVAAPLKSGEVEVREFKSFTTDLYELASWLEECGVKTVAMESTGVYWIPLFELLESRGFEVRLVDARHVKNVSGRKTDVLDCQWIQELHTFGLLLGAFRPNEQVCVLRAYLRQRGMLIREAGKHIQHMQKALSQMNVLLHNVLSDITGECGMKIIREIVSGNHDPKMLARHRDGRCKSSVVTIEKSLAGNYRKEHLFALTQALELYDAYKEKIRACDQEIEEQLGTFEAHQLREASQLDGKKRIRSKSNCKNAPSFDVNAHLVRMTGVDLTAIPGIEASTALKIISEIGLDLSRWKSEKQFASWLGLCPGNKVTGGKRLSGKTKRTSNNAASILRIAASTLHKSKTSLGAFYRRLKTRVGAPKAITAAAHKIAKIIFSMLKTGEEYRESGQNYYEEQYRDRLIKNLNKRAKEFGFDLVKREETMALECAVL